MDQIQTSPITPQPQPPISTPISSQPLPELSPPIPTNFRKWVIIGFIGISSLALIGASVYFAYRRYAIVKYDRLQTECLSKGGYWGESFPPTCILASSAPNLYREPIDSAATANWKTYTNTKYRYSIKYPESYKPQVTAPGVGVVTADDKANSLTIGTVSILAFEYPPREYILQDWTKSEVIVNGFTGTKYVKEKEGNSSVDTSIVRLPVGSITYILKHPSEDIYVQIITKNDQILSTFKFINSISNAMDNADFNGWETYNNPSLGIQFKYPNSLKLSEGDFSVPNGLGSGSHFYIYLTGKGSSPDISLGGISKNFSEGRGGMFTDTQGYIEKNGNYYCVGLDSEVLIDKSRVKKTTNSQGVEMLVVISGVGEPNMAGETNCTEPDFGNIGVLINLKNNQKYSGLGILYKKSGSSLPDIVIDQILSTFKFTTN